jgi:tetratricopeptide (TPR) repeat protein
MARKSLRRHTSARKAGGKAVAAPLRAAWLALALTTGALPAGADDVQVAKADSVNNSSMDAPLFYQLMIGEMELRSGQAGTAYEVMLDAAKRTRDATLFRRAMDIALNARAGDQALAATRAWRQSVPGSLDALRYQAQILLAMNRVTDAAEPLREWLSATPAADRPGLIVSLPRLLERLQDKRQAADLVDRLVTPWRDGAATRVPARLAQGRAWLAAGDRTKVLALAREAQDVDAGSPAGALLALELLPNAEAEQLVQAQLARPQAEAGLRLSYARALTQSQRYVDAAAQIEQVTREQPQLAPPWLSLGALRLELRQPREAEQALQRFLALAQAAKPAGQPATAAPAPAAGEDDDDDDPHAGPATQTGDDRNLTQAQLLLAQAAEQRGDLPAAEAWLAKIDDPQRALEVQSRRAGLLARAGKLDEARELIRKVPERNAEEARAKTLAEAQMLRDAKRLREAAQLLDQVVRANPDDLDLAYELAMVYDKLQRFDDMERLLRRVIEKKPDHAHAHNALGYSLADRNLRLPEARQLIQRALELTPGDPFITDSLGWVEFRLGNTQEALRQLRQAWSKRPDPEIGAHLGEVLWAAGQRDEARRIWQESRGRDATNEVLSETLTRLKVGM